MINSSNSQLRIWSACGSTYKEHHVLKSIFDEQTDVLTIQEYPELAVDSLSCMRLDLSLSSLVVPASVYFVHETIIVSFRTKSDAHARVHVPESNPSKVHEESVTLEMCCSMFDISIAAGDRVDLIIESATYISSDLDRFLAAIDQSSSNQHSSELIRSDVTHTLPSKGQCGLSDRNSPIRLPIPVTIKDGSTLLSDDLINGLDSITLVSSHTTPLKDSTWQCHVQETRPKKYGTKTKRVCEDDLNKENSKPVVKWNNVALANGAEPRKSINFVTKEESLPCYAPIRFVMPTVANDDTGGYMRSKRIDYISLSSDEEPSRIGILSKHRTRRVTQKPCHLTNAPGGPHLGSRTNHVAEMYQSPY